MSSTVVGPSSPTRTIVPVLATTNGAPSPARHTMLTGLSKVPLSVKDTAGGLPVVVALGAVVAVVAVVVVAVVVVVVAALVGAVVAAVVEPADAATEVLASAAL